MMERLDLEEAQGLMRRLKYRAVEIVESHGGIVILNCIQNDHSFSVPFETQLTGASQEHGKWPRH